MGEKLIEPLTLSVRAENGLRDSDTHTLDDLRKYSSKELMRIPFFGKKTLKEIEAELAKIGRSLRLSPLLPPDAPATTAELQARVTVLEAAVKWLVEKVDPLTRSA